MAKNQIIFFSLTSFRRLKRSLLTFLTLVAVTALLCLVASPVLVKATSANPVVSSSEIRPNQNLLQQGKALYDAGQYTEAVKVLQQVATDAEAQRDPLKQAIALSDLSLVYQQLGQWPQATTAITSSLKLLQTLQHEGGSKELLRILALAQNIQGKLRLALGQSEQALDSWQQATATYKKAGLTTGVIASLLNQVQAEQSMGLYLQAKDMLIEVRQNLTSQPDSLVKTKALLSLGNTLRIIGSLGESRKYLQQSLDIAQKLKSPSDISATLLGLGNTAYSQQDTQAALKFYQQAAAASTSPMARTQAQLNQLRLMVETKSWSDAIALWPQIQSEIAELPPSRTEVYARIDLAQSLTRLIQGGAERIPSWLEIDQILATAVEQAKNLGDARAEAYALGYLGGVYEQTTQWSQAQKLTQQALILAQSINAPDVGYRFSWQLGRLLKAQGDINGAITSYTEAVYELKSLRNNLVGVNPDIQFSFRDQVEPVYRQLVDLLLQGQEPSQQNLVQAREVIESLQLAELNNFFQAACLSEKTVKLDQIVEQQDPKAAVIYPIILPDRIEVILKLPTQHLRHYKTTISSGEVEKLLEDLRRDLVEPDRLLTTQSLSKQVYDWLLRPIETELAKSQVKTLVFVLDGSLRNIPMASLYDGQQYLVQKYALALSPGLQLLAPLPSKQVKLKALTAGLTEAHSGFSPLNGVSVELAQIKSEIPSTVLLNQKFTSTALQTKTDESTFSVVHLATHGEFSSQADKTFILAWDKRISVKELNNIIQTRDSSTSTSALQLLVLSACETAAGDKRAALGLAGVAVQSGARSTIASLWSVQDQPTAALMSQFYQNLANAHMTKAEALRQAQITLLKQIEFQRPISWAPYVLVGSWL